MLIKHCSRGKDNKVFDWKAVEHSNSISLSNNLSSSGQQNKIESNAWYRQPNEPILHANVSDELSFNDGNFTPNPNT